MGYELILFKFCRLGGGTKPNITPIRVKESRCSLRNKFRTMNRIKIKVEELLQRYAAGERDFSNIRLSDRGANLLYGCNLSGINLSGSRIGAYLADTDLSGANLSGVSMPETTFDRANLNSANLSKAVLWQSCFIDANLSNADLSGADILKSEWI